MNQNSLSIIEKILELAKWAPSGDNMQTWRFEIIDGHKFVVHAFDTRSHCVYDLQGRASQLALGCLLENITIAASSFGFKVLFDQRLELPETNPTFDVTLEHDVSVNSDPLLPFITTRSVQRRAMKTSPLTVEEKNALENAIGDTYKVKWFEGWSGRLKAAWLTFSNAKLRFTLPEAFPTHSTIIAWNSRFSEDKIPDQAVGLDPLAAWIMKWALKSWARVKFLNTYFAGTLLPRIELDLWPGLMCAGHFALVATNNPESIQDHINAGRALQRFWLTATQLNLQLQPEMTPLIFSSYIRNKQKFTNDSDLVKFAEKLSLLIEELLGKNTVNQVVFLGRIGKGEPAYSRSLRLSLEKLLSSHQ